MTQSNKQRKYLIPFFLCYIIALFIVSVNIVLSCAAVGIILITGKLDKLGKFLYNLANNAQIKYNNLSNDPSKEEDQV